MCVCVCVTVSDIITMSVMAFNNCDPLPCDPLGFQQLSVHAQFDPLNLKCDYY